jgi:chromosome segregation ATPase
MPEITSVEAIRQKLQQFDAQVDGAIAAAQAIKRVKSDSEKQLKVLEEQFNQGEQALRKADGIQLQLQEIQAEWERLKQEVAMAQTERKQTRDHLLTELDRITQSVGKRLVEAEEQLRSTNRASLAEQEEKLQGIESRIGKNADAAEQANALTQKRANDLEKLLATLRDELQSDVGSKLQDAEDRLESQFQEVRNGLDAQSARHERFLQTEIDAFKDAVKHDLAEHEGKIDRQITEFLNKQNALIQNLTQQIDSFHRVSRTQSEAIVATRTSLKELASEFNTDRAATTRERATLAEDIRELKVRVEKVELSLFDVAERLKSTLDKLKTLFMVGSKFK